MDGAEGAREVFQRSRVPHADPMYRQAPTCSDGHSFRWKTSREGSRNGQDPRARRAPRHPRNRHDPVNARLHGSRVQPVGPSPAALRASASPRVAGRGDPAAVAAIHPKASGRTERKGPARFSSARVCHTRIPCIAKLPHARMTTVSAGKLRGKAPATDRTRERPNRLVAQPPPGKARHQRRSQRPRPARQLHRSRAGRS